MSILYEKILIIGVSGSGKTTLGIILSKLFDIQSYDMDEYYWEPGWRINNKEDVKKN